MTQMQSSTRQAQEPVAVADYFGGLVGYDREHAVIEETFAPGRGWVRCSMRKRINPTWARKLRREGITAVAVRSAGRLADFQIAQVVR